MINTSRQVDTMLFHLEQDVDFGDTTVLKGWNQIKRVDNIYNVFRLEDRYQAYTFIHLDEMPNLLHVLFEKMINAGYIDELNDVVAPHTHTKKLKMA